jgi:pyruvate/2-oxoglutarate dehydrogenase complex dihydrolipoamide dehydrogenase (E3) component
VPYLTNETLFELSELPGHLAVIGGGPIGIEMAQAFRRLGSKVDVIEQADTILQKEDAELAEMLQARLTEEEVNVHSGAKITSVDQDEQEVRIGLEGKTDPIRATHLLVATGRQPNIQPLDLDKADIRYSSKGIHVNGYGQSSRPHIYAIGDVTGNYQLTHMSEQTAKVAVTHALLKLPVGIDTRNVPRVTFTDPELGHTGLSASELDSKKMNYETYHFPYSKIDRAVMEGESFGMIKVFANKVTGKIYGASVLGAHAGELISEYTVAMKNGVSLRALADTIHPYPSWTLGARRAADQWYIKIQSEWSVKLIKGVFGYRGEVPDLSDPDRVI